jgi:hypothetical protein
VVRSYPGIDRLAEKFPIIDRGVKKVTRVGSHRSHPDGQSTRMSLLEDEDDCFC